MVLGLKAVEGLDTDREMERERGKDKTQEGRLGERRETG